MNSPKVVVALGLVLISSLILTACGGGSKAPTPTPSAPTIQTLILPQGAVNAPYNAVFSATGGSGNYSWSITAGSLPPGLSLNASQGTISGTPTTLGNYPFTVMVTDTSTNLTASTKLSIYIEGVVVVSSTCGESKVADFCPSGAMNVAYTNPDGTAVQLTASGGLCPFKWAVSSGSLPAGLSLAAGTCANSKGTAVISGTPTMDGAPATLNVSVTDSETSPGVPAVGSGQFTITIMSITTTSLPAGYLNSAYTGSLTVAGGSTPYNWCVVEKSGLCDDGSTGAFPPGLMLDHPTCFASKTQTCLIDGTPTQAGNYPVTINLTDGERPQPATASMMYTISVYQSQLVINTTTLPPGIEGVPYNATLTASGGLQPYTWSITSGSLPPGLSLNTTTCVKSSVPCVVSGTPTTTGPFNFTIQVQDSEQPPQTVSAKFSILISFSPLSITTTSLPAGTESVPYSANLTASGGLKPYSWSVIKGSLPPGLSLNPTTCTNSSVPCIISGTPTASGTYPFTVQVQDSGTPQQTVPAQLSIVVNPPLGNGTLSGAYVFTFSGYSSGTQVFMAGAFVADGNGNLTGGELDYNNGSGEGVPPVQQTFTTGSVYSITSTGQGTMTIVTSTATYQFVIVVRGDGSGRLIQSDSSNKQAYGSGAIKVQNLYSLCPTLQGTTVAVGLFGFDSSLKRYAGAGEFNFNISTCADITGEMDSDDNGSAATLTFSGAFNGGDSFGRSYLQIGNWKPASPCGSHPCTYASYVVSQNEVVLIATDSISQPATLTLWSALRQLSSGGGFNNSNLAGIRVLESSALDTNGAVDVTAGLFTGQGVSGNDCQNNGYDSATFTFDENQGGKCNGGTCGSQPQSVSGTYCVDQVTGRVSTKGFTGTGAFGGAPPVFYLAGGANGGFVVGTDPAVTSGYFEPQESPPFSNSSLFGLYAGGTINPVTMNVTNGVSELFADGNGNISGTEYASGPGGPAQTPYTYTYTVDSTGRAIVQNSGSTIGIAYVISSTKFALMPATDPNPALSIYGE